MKLGVDFDGTIYRYRVYRKWGSWNPSVFAQTKTLEEAQNILKEIMENDKKVKQSVTIRYWIMKVTRHYERVFDTESEEQT